MAGLKVLRNTQVLCPGRASIIETPVLSYGRNSLWQAGCISGGCPLTVPLRAGPSPGNLYSSRYSMAVFVCNSQGICSHEKNFIAGIYEAMRHKRRCQQMDINKPQSGLKEPMTLNEEIIFLICNCLDGRQIVQ